MPVPSCVTLSICTLNRNGMAMSGHGTDHEPAITGLLEVVGCEGDVGVGFDVQQAGGPDVLVTSGVV
jgi:hypothetical protein